MLVRYKPIVNQLQEFCMKFYLYKKLIEQKHKATDFAAQQDLAYSM